MIVAKAANMDLVVFSKRSSSNRWVELEINKQCISFNETHSYFLCLQQHKEACFHWLNGGEAETDRSFDEFVLVDEASDRCFKWWSEGWFMQEDYRSRIKPRKEKRWIAYSSNNKRLGVLTFSSEGKARAHYMHEVYEPQFIEIEVEV